MAQASTETALELTPTFSAPSEHPSDSEQEVGAASASSCAAAPRIFGGHIAWTSEEDAVLREVHAEQLALVSKGQPTGEGWKPIKLSGRAEWDRLTAEFNKKSPGPVRSAGGVRGRHKSLEDRAEPTNNSAAIDVDAPRTTRPKKRSVDDSFISSDVDAETAGKRRASVESAIASGSTVASFTRSSSRDTHASSAASSEPIEDLFDPSSPAPSSADSIPPDAPEWSTYGQKRPWSQEDVVKLMDLKTGSSDPSTKARSYSMLEKDFPGRAGGSIASKWSKIKDSVKIRMLVGEAKRAKKLHARDRTIKATLTGPRRMTWQSFQAQLQQSSQRMQKEEGQRRGEMDLQGSAFCSAPPPPPAMHFSHLSPTKHPTHFTFRQPPPLDPFLGPSFYNGPPHPSTFFGPASAYYVDSPAPPARPMGLPPPLSSSPVQPVFVIPRSRPAPAAPAQAIQDSSPALADTKRPNETNTLRGEVFRGRRMSVRLGAQQI